MPEFNYLDIIKKNIYDVNSELRQINNLHEITKNSLDELRVNYNCCCDLAIKFNKHMSDYNAGIAAYNDFLSRLKSGQWVKDSKFLMKINELLQITKLLVKNAFALDKVVFDQLFKLDDTKRKEGSDSVEFKNLLALMQLPPVPTTCPIHKKGGKTKKYKKKTMNQKKYRKNQTKSKRKTKKN